MYVELIECLPLVDIVVLNDRLEMALPWHLRSLQYGIKINGVVRANGKRLLDPGRYAVDPRMICHLHHVVSAHYLLLINPVCAAVGIVLMPPLLDRAVGLASVFGCIEGLRCCS